MFPTTGVTQGSILSTFLFSVYVDDMLNCLHYSKLGCQIKYTSFNAFMYADYLIRMSISICDLQNMLDICADELCKIDMCVNASKSSCLRVGARFNANVAFLVIDNEPLKWNSEIKYLRLTILAGQILQHDFHPVKAKLFGALNSILGKVGTRASERVLLHLTYSKCS